MLNLNKVNSRQHTIKYSRLPRLPTFPVTFILPRLNGGKAVFSKKVMEESGEKREGKKKSFINLALKGSQQAM